MAKHRTGHLFKRGDTFYVRWAVDGKVFSKALHEENGKPITDRRRAEQARAEVMAPFTVGGQVEALESITAKLEGRKAELARLQDEQNPALPISKGWVEYAKALNRPDTGESTMRQYEFQFGQFARWMAEHHAEAPAMRDVTKEIAEQYASSLNDGRLSPGTFNKHLNVLTLVFRVLKDKAKLASNPWADIQRKRLATQSRRELTLDELRKVCGSAGGELRTLLALGVYSGLRLGDCATLRRAEIDRARNFITRIPNKTARRNPKPVIVPIHPVLRSILEETSADKHQEYVLAEIAPLYLRRTDMVTDLVQRHFAACGIKTWRPGTGQDGKRASIEVGFHSLRHSFVSLCRASNAPLAVVESIVGHSNPAMTRHYTHVGELASTSAVAALPSVIGEDSPPPTTDRMDARTLLQEVEALVKGMTQANWRARRDQALGLLVARRS